MKTAKLIVYPKRDKLNKVTNECDLYARLTVKGKRAGFSINRKVNIDQWKATNQLLKARKPEARELLNYIDAIKEKIKIIERELIEAGVEITATRLKNIYFGKENISQKNQPTILKIFKNYISEFETLVLSGANAEGTLNRYRQAMKHIQEFIKWQYSKSDLNIYDLKYEFIKNFDLYLRSEKKCGNNSTVKYVRNVRTMIKHAVLDEIIPYDPFSAYSKKIIKTNRVFLTFEEINKIEEKHFNLERLETVKDIFLFSVYTGYAYCEAKKLTPQNLVKGEDGEWWIVTSRTKTNVQENMMLFPVPLAVIEKYKNHPLCKQNNVLLPVPTNQRVNGYLKEIADCCGIKKNITFHTARHSFASSIMLLNGASFETTMTAIGHDSIKQTQHYGKMQSERISKELIEVRKNILARKNKTANE